MLFDEISARHIERYGKPIENLLKEIPRPNLEARKVDSESLQDLTRRRWRPSKPVAWISCKHKEETIDHFSKSVLSAWKSKYSGMKAEITILPFDAPLTDRGPDGQRVLYRDL
jgi:hypothetical protein